MRGAPRQKRGRQRVHWQEGNRKQARSGCWCDLAREVGVGPVGLEPLPFCRVVERIVGNYSLVYHL